jgi:hypothetical protein
VVKAILRLWTAVFRRRSQVVTRERGYIPGTVADVSDAREWSRAVPRRPSWLGSPPSSSELRLRVLLKSDQPFGTRPWRLSGRAVLYRDDV